MVRKSLQYCFLGCLLTGFYFLGERGLFPIATQSYLEVLRTKAGKLFHDNASLFTAKPQVTALMVRNASEKDGKQLLLELQLAIHHAMEETLFTYEDLEKTTEGIDRLEEATNAALKKLNQCELKGKEQNTARVLEQILLTRIRELIVIRKSCETSYGRALHDTYQETYFDRDIEKRRNRFSSGANVRWKEGRQRILTQMSQDLRRLDTLVATATF